MIKNRIYIAIDLKSFYASVECVQRNLNPLDANLVVADASRTNKTICLAVSPSLKKLGVSGRPRLFEVEQCIRHHNMLRRSSARHQNQNIKKSYSAQILEENPTAEIDYIIAPPQMARYLEVSNQIYAIYLRHVSPDDIHIYSVDEVFIDATAYLPLLKITAHQFAIQLIREVLRETGITATAGIGSNLYLAKVAMDIVAKRMNPDSDGVRIAELDEMEYRRKLWSHKPLTDFWRVGRGTTRRLADYGIETMGDIARCSINHENLLYKLFGINAELLIDHAWGWEPVLISDIKRYRPATHSLSSGQVLTEPYTATNARIVAQEMAEGLALDLIRKQLTTAALTIEIGYDTESLTRKDIAEKYTGPVDIDHYGRRVPRHSHGSARLPRPTQAVVTIREEAAKIFDRIANTDLLIRRLTICANETAPQDSTKTTHGRQLELFTDFGPTIQEESQIKKLEERDIRLHGIVNNIKQQFGKNAILKGLNFAEGSTARQRNSQIGGHKA